MWFSSPSLATLFIIVFHITSGEQNVRRRRQLSPPLPEKYSVYVKPLPADNKQTQQNKPFFSFAQEQNQPFHLPMKKQNQPQERLEVPQPQYLLPLSPQSQTKKWTQSSSVKVSYISTEPQLQYQLPIQPLQSQTPLASQTQPTQIRPKYLISSLSSHELPSQLYSHNEPRISSHTKSQLYNFPTHTYYQPSAHSRLQPPLLQSQNQQPNNYQQEFFQSGDSKQINKPERENPQIVLMNDQAFVMNSKQTQTPESSRETRQSHSSHAILSSSTTDAIFQDKLLSSVQPQLQSVIQKAPASEIEYSKGSPAKDKGNSEDGYVIYYYYYYEDPEKAANNTNSSLKFDDIPDLKDYDQAKNESSFEKDEKINSSTGAENMPATRENNTFSDASSLRGHSLGQKVGSLTFNNTDQSKNVDVSSRNFKESATPVRPISNVYRYGNDVPRFPLAPNLVNYSNMKQNSSLNANISVEDKKEQVPVDLTTHNASSFTSPGETNILDSVHANDTVVKSNEILEVNTEPLTKNIESTETGTTTETESTIREDTIATTKSVATHFNNRIHFGSGRLPGLLRLRKRPILALSTTTTQPENGTNDNEESTTIASRISKFRPRFGSGRTSINFSRRRPSFGNKSRFGIFKNGDSNKKEDGDEKDEHKNETLEPATTLSSTVVDYSQSVTRRNFINSHSTTSKPTTLISRILPSNIFNRSRNRPRLPFLRRERNSFKSGRKIGEINDEDEEPKEEGGNGESEEETFKTDNKTAEEQTFKREDDKAVREENSREKTDKTEKGENSKEVGDQAKEEEYQKEDIIVEEEKYKNEGNKVVEGEQYKEEGNKAVEGEQYKEEGNKEVEGEQYKEEGNKAVEEEKYKEEGNKAVEVEQYKEEGNKAVEVEQYKEEGNKAVEVEQYKEEGNKAVEGEQYKEEGNKEVEGEQYKEEGNKEVEGEQYKEEGNKEVEGEQYKEEGNKAVEEEQYKKEDKAVEGEKYKEKGNKTVEGEQYKEEEDKAVEGEQYKEEEEDKAVEGEQYKEEDEASEGKEYKDDKEVEGEQYQIEEKKAVEGKEYKKEEDEALEGKEYKEDNKEVEGEQYQLEEKKAVEGKEYKKEEDEALEGKEYEEDNKEVEGEKFKKDDRIAEEKQPNEEEDTAVEKVNKEGEEAIENEKYEEQKPLKIVPSISTTGATTTFTLFITPSLEVETTTVTKDLDETENIQTTTETLTTTTEGNRFLRLFRKRKRPTLFGNRPRLTISNRSR